MKTHTNSFIEAAMLAFRRPVGFRTKRQRISPKPFGTMGALGRLWHRTGAEHAARVEAAAVEKRLSEYARI